MLSEYIKKQIVLHLLEEAVLPQIRIRTGDVEGSVVNMERKLESATDLGLLSEGDLEHLVALLKMAEDC